MGMSSVAADLIAGAVASALDTVIVKGSAAPSRTLTNDEQPPSEHSQAPPQSALPASELGQATAGSCNAIKDVGSKPPPNLPSTQQDQSSPDGSGPFVSSPSARRPTEQSVDVHPQRKGRVIYFRGPADGATIRCAGRRERATIEVVQESSPLYKLSFFVKIVEGISTSAGESDDKIAGTSSAPTDELALAASLSLDKSDIESVIQRWTQSSDNSPRNAFGEVQHEEEHLEADAALRLWGATGDAPYREHILLWLLQRLELIREALPTVAEADTKQSRWALVLSQVGAYNAPRVATSATCASPEERGGEMAIHQDLKGEAGDEGALLPGWSGGRRMGRPRGDRWTTSTADTCNIARSLSLSRPGVYAGPLMTRTLTDCFATDTDSAEGIRMYRSSSGAMTCTAPAPLTHVSSAPAQATTTAGQASCAPPYGHDASAAADSRTSSHVGDLLRHPMPHDDSRGDGSTAGGDRVDHRTTSKTAIPDTREGLSHLSALAGERPWNMQDARNSASDSWHRNPEEVGSEHGEKGMGDDDVHVRERRRNQRSAQEGDVHMLDHSGNRPDTARERLRSPWGTLAARRAATIANDGQRPSFTSRTEKKDRRRKAPMRGRDDRRDDRFKLTRHLEYYERELAQADERRRRAEIEATAAESQAWGSVTQGRNGEAEKRARARTATQRVLDLMLVAERVRQEEQRRRVAAARASEQAARCKQPFRERRGRSRKGACIGPPIRPRHEAERPRDRHADAASEAFCWDENGRRHGRLGHGATDRTSTEEEFAVESVRIVAAACLEKGTDFRQPFRKLDADGDGRLSLAEFGTALRRAGARLGLSHVAAVFRRFVGGTESDTIAYRDFFWELIDKKRLLDQWRAAGELIPGGRTARAACFRDRAKALSNGGHQGQGLRRRDFRHALQEINVNVQGWEAEALLDSFEADDSGEIDWQGFLSVMDTAEQEDNGGRQGYVEQETISRQWSATAPPRAFHRSSFATNRLGETTHPPRRRPGSGIERRNDETRTGLSDVDREDKRLDFHERAAFRRSGLFEPSSHQNTFWSTLPRAFPPERSGPTATMPHATVDRPSAFASRTSASDKLGRDWQFHNRGSRILDCKDASRIVDDLLEDQRELEAFLDEELAKSGGS